MKERVKSTTYEVTMPDYELMLDILECARDEAENAYNEEARYDTPSEEFRQQIIQINYMMDLVRQARDSRPTI
jgi:hypothetical protein